MQKSTAPLFQGAPDQHLRLPQEGNVTFVEIAAFLPNWLRSADVIFRLASNGHKNEYSAHAINYHRLPDDKGNVTNNTICKIFMQAMREADQAHIDPSGLLGGDRWTQTRHDDCGLKDGLGQPWDAGNLTLTGMQPRLAHCNNRRTKFKAIVENIPFKDLAKRLRNWPSVEQGDGLDLTRCVHHAATHPDEIWMFPGDFTKLTTKIGGPLPVSAKNFDGAAFQRWRRARVAEQEALVPGMTVNPAPGRTTTQSSASTGAQPRSSMNNSAIGYEQARPNIVARRRSEPSPGFRGQQRPSEDLLGNGQFGDGHQENHTNPYWQYPSGSLNGGHHMKGPHFSGSKGFTRPRDVPSAEDLFSRTGASLEFAELFPDLSTSPDTQIFTIIERVGPSGHRARANARRQPRRPEPVTRQAGTGHNCVYVEAADLHEPENRTRGQRMPYFVAGAASQQMSPHPLSSGHNQNNFIGLTETSPAPAPVLSSDNREVTTATSNNNVEPLTAPSNDPEPNSGLSDSPKLSPELTGRLGSGLTWQEEFLTSP
ncbi:hypothetical protein GQ44DRAFT_726794 [Phaeosphaeriaceae sp. PMI808]|nr:hypothetical protein GQ44DRAFT_726794 [Phaeosphaeriaceae sp. PMI808]